MVDARGVPVAIVRNGKRFGIDGVREEWLIDDEWWREPIARRYVEVILQRGARMVLYQDLNSGRWFEQ